MKIIVLKSIVFYDFLSFSLPPFSLTSFVIRSSIFCSFASIGFNEILLTIYGEREGGMEFYRKLGWDENTNHMQNSQIYSDFHFDYSRLHKDSITFFFVFG